MTDTENTEINFTLWKGSKDAFKEKEDKKLALTKEISKVYPSSHLSFLFGAGTSMPDIPDMKKLTKEYAKKMEGNGQAIRKIRKKTIHNNPNLEKYLDSLFSLINTFPENKKVVNDEIKKVKEHIFYHVNKTDGEILKVYETFYKKMMYRDGALSKINIFTTNYDLFNEIAMDNLGIVFCNGFSGNINRYFNPMTFNYAYAEQIGLSADKYTAVENYIYLYKLHGSINWIEAQDSESFYNIQEVQKPKSKQNHIMIYPTPTKQSHSFSSPYSDLFREFQKKLMIQDNILVVIGYSFSDEHVNNIIYQALATVPKFRLIIFAHSISNEIEKLKAKDDPRIWIIEGNENTKNICKFEYIVENLLSETNQDDENIEKMLKSYFNNK